MQIKRWHGLMVWAVVSLMAIAFVGDAPYVSVGFAVGGGAVFGLVNWYAYRRAALHDRDAV